MPESLEKNPLESNPRQRATLVNITLGRQNLVIENIHARRMQPLEEGMFVISQLVRG